MEAGQIDYGTNAVDLWQGRQARESQDGVASIEAVPECASDGCPGLRTCDPDGAPSIGRARLDRADFEHELVLIAQLLSFRGAIREQLG